MFSFQSFRQTGEFSRGMVDRQRLDKWLWFARVVKTRSLAARLVNDGHVRINGRRIETPAHPVSQSDVLTIALEHQVRVLRVLGPGLRREAYPIAKLLFEDLTFPGDHVESGPTLLDESA